MSARTCRYCGRTGQKQFLLMPDGLWRCKSPDYCQRRARAAYATPHAAPSVSGPLGVVGSADSPETPGERL